MPDDGQYYYACFMPAYEFVAEQSPMPSRSSGSDIRWHTGALRGSQA